MMCEKEFQIEIIEARRTQKVRQSVRPSGRFVNGGDFEYDPAITETTRQTMFCYTYRFLKPEECVIVEDSFNGVRAAKASGAACIGFYNPDSGNQDLSLADIVVEGFEEVDCAFAEKVHHRTFGIPVTLEDGI